MRILPLVLVVVAASPALAENDGEARSSRSYHALTMRLSDRDIDDAATSFEGVAVGIGRRFGASTLYGEVELGYQHRDKLDGVGTSVALHAQRRICEFALIEGSDELAIPCWVDIGVGWSTLLTRDTTLARPMISLGVGGGLEAASRRRRGGLMLGLALELSPVTAAARRLAPQAERTTEPAANRVDAGVRLDVTFLFGR